jgi:hypothetical protein
MYYLASYRLQFYNTLLHYTMYSVCSIDVLLLLLLRKTVRLNTFTFIHYFVVRGTMVMWACGDQKVELMRGCGPSELRT